jgi:hypothetical protein
VCLVLSLPKNPLTAFPTPFSSSLPLFSSSCPLASTLSLSFSRFACSGDGLKLRLGLDSLPFDLMRLTGEDESPFVEAKAPAPRVLTREMALASPSSTTCSSSPGVGGSTWYRRRDGEPARFLVLVRMTSVEDVASCRKPFFERKTLVFLMIWDKRSPVWDHA